MAKSKLRQRLAALAGVAALAFAVPQAAAGDARPVVIELYTSQGCSSCLPADGLLARLADRRDVLALTLPITYWDMLGWKDTLASKANTDRQKAYSQAMGRGGVYTPQAVVDGINDLVGSREDLIEKAIAARQSDLPDVPIGLSLSPGQIHVTVEAGRAGPDATIWMFAVHPRASVKIGSGENAGRTAFYRDVVTEVKAIGLWKGKKVTLDLPRDALGGAWDDGVAVILQQSGYGPVLGATAIVYPDGKTH